jgi:hypothetical protein
MSEYLSEYFFLFGMIIGIVQIVDGIVLKLNNGKFNTITSTTSFIEFLWLIVCVYSLFKLNFPSWTLALPACYVSYFIVGFYHAGKLMSGMTEKELMELKAKSPKIFMDISIVFGILYFLASSVAFWQNHL